MCARGRPLIALATAAVVWAMSPRCAWPAAPELVPPARGPAPGPARTPAQWLAAIEAGEETLGTEKCALDPELALGAALATVCYYRDDKSWGAPLTPAQKAAVEKFHEFMRTKGNALWDSLCSGNPLPPEEQMYFYLLHAECFKWYDPYAPKEKLSRLTPRERERRAYSEKVMSRGDDLMRKGYLGGSYTPAEIRDLRLYAVWTQTQCVPDQMLPYTLGLTRKERPQWGEEAPDFCLPRMEMALRSPRYSDLNPTDPVIILRPGILTEYLLALQGYEAKKNAAGEMVCVAKPYETPVKDRQNFVRLSDFRGRRPVVLLFSDPVDIWCWWGKIAPAFNAVAEMYRGKAEFYVVHITCHDIWMPSRDYFGPGPHGRTNALHPLSLEHRARHEKSHYMSYPNHTVDYLMDDMGHRTRNAYANSGGNAMIVLVDVDGKVAYNDKQDSPENWVPSEIMGRGLVKVRPWQVPLMNWQMLRATTLQRELHAVLANGGKAVPSGKRPPVLGELQFTLEGAKIIEVNPAAQTVTLRGKSWNAPEPLTLTLSVTGTTRLVRRANGKPVAARLGDFRVGETINAGYFPDKDTQGGRARWLGEGGLQASADPIWAYGRIEKLDRSSSVITVRVQPPETGRMRGYNFWKEAEGKATLAAEAAVYMPIVSKWVEAGKAGLPYRFRMDDATEVFVNGQPATCAELEENDTVAVQYSTRYQGLETIWPDLALVTR